MKTLNKNKDPLLKRIEYNAKLKIDSILLKNKNEPQLIRNPEKIFHKENIKRILLLRHDRIGDVLISVPFLMSLRQALPVTTIDILLSDKNIGTKDAIGQYIDNIYTYDKKINHSVRLFRQLRKNKYDLIIDLFDNVSTTSQSLIRFVSPLFSLSLDKNNRKFYTHVVPLLDKNQYHIVDRVARLLLPFGINPEEADLRLEYDVSDNEMDKAEAILGPKSNIKRVGVNLSGSSKAKYWGTENNINFINLLLQNAPNIDVVLFCTEGYIGEGEKIAGNTAARIAKSVASLNQYAAMLKTCDLIITPDTAAVHFAAAFRIPCVALYKITGNSQSGLPWTPYKSPFKAITTSSNLSEISPEEVLEAALTFIFNE